MDNEAHLKLIKTIKKQIEYLEYNDPDNPKLDELKML